MSMGKCFRKVINLFWLGCAWGSHKNFMASHADMCNTAPHLANC
jgi:hypothetical protein